MGKPFIQKKGTGKSNLSLHCQQCLNPVIKRIHKKGKPQVNGCMKWSMPKEPRGRKTIEQRAVYYGWHLILMPNLKMNNIPKEQINFFKKAFFEKNIPKNSVEKLKKIVSKQTDRGEATIKRIARMRINRILLDTNIIKKQVTNGEYTLETKKMFEEYSKNFETNLKKILENL
jgi:hypothetical protein